MVGEEGVEAGLKTISRTTIEAEMMIAVEMMTVAEVMTVAAAKIAIGMTTTMIAKVRIVVTEHPNRIAPKAPTVAQSAVDVDHVGVGVQEIVVTIIAQLAPDLTAVVLETGAGLGIAQAVEAEEMETFADDAETAIEIVSQSKWMSLNWSKALACWSFIQMATAF